MGANHSREDLDLSDTDESDSESQETTHQESESEELYGTPSSHPSDRKRADPKMPSSLDEVEARLKALKLKYSSNNINPKNAVKLYLHVGGHTTTSKWVVSEKLAPYVFVKTNGGNEEDDDAGGDYSENEGGSDPNSWWVLKIGSKVRAKVDENLQLKAFKEQRRVDFVSNGVWAVKFSSLEEWEGFTRKYQDCLFENTHGYEANDENKLKVYGKDFIGWANPQAADDSMWEDAEESLTRTPPFKTPVKRVGHDLTEELEEAAADGAAIQSLALGALDNSFLVSNSGIQVVRNYSHGIQGKGICVTFDGDGKLGSRRGTGAGSSYLTPRKALLMKAETNMLLMSPMDDGKPHSSALHQLDIETGRVVSEWKFEKDGADISMRDITNDSKGAQMDPTGSTFLGLDDNRLCRWDMRDRRGMVQNIVNESTPVLNWTQGHQFSRGTNFQCFAATGDGSIVVGSLDGKIRLYSTSSMRQAKTAFPGLGSPITHVDVTYDGKWILGTTDTYLILICSLFTDKDGNTKTGFAGRMGNRISAPRLLKLNPLDSHMAGANKFRNAQFSWVTESGKQERHLVATVGKFSVIWNFQQVKDGSHECYQNQVGLKSCYCYKIVLKDDSIVESRFMHEKFAVSDSPEAPLVVATPLKVSSFSISSRRLQM
ncbi:Vacuolar import/degradation- Vid27-related protein [Striga hermonthica]|uniref:Vacuolar import/degradation- Vid27-related protein n=1 Tax=Striga hermonthica TaxID=68872 RepID=A0A9N7N3X3_STRHE|nr:Vacuolar import/degradation- Vid27-related protein [Striga hermonthica]